LRKLADQATSVYGRREPLLVFDAAQCEPAAEERAERYHRKT